MKVASQLRLAIGVVIALLAGILAAALYVPAELERSTNEKYVEDAIPLRDLAHTLTAQLLEQEAALQAYLNDGDPDDLQRFTRARADANAVLGRLTAFSDRHPELTQLIREATIHIGNLVGLFQAQLDATPRDRVELRSELATVLEQLKGTSARILAATNRTLADANREQSSLYRQLLVVLFSLGTVALGVGTVLFLVTPRRVGQLYDAEQRSRREAESRAEAARALEHVSDGVILTDADGRVRFWNPGAENLTGIDEHGAMGRELGRLLPGWERLARQPGTHPGGGAAVVPIELGHERWLSITGVDFGEGVVYAVRDVTEERALETMRSDFVATASHELRTPMTSISGAALTLLRRSGELAPERRDAFLEMIVSESERLSRIVDQILLASRLEAGSVEVVHEACDAAEVVGSVVEGARHRAPEGIRLRFDPPDDLPEVDCDPDRLRQVLVNVIDNAIKFSPAGGEVRIELEPVGEALRFAVHDEGVGFDPTASERIFERFHRLDPQQTQGIGGTGLGLYICRELVQRMGGRIWAEAERGEGASFYFELPLVHEAARASQRQRGTAG
jgi:two-component system phosphate regulon sensor histidine kinase PhoR